MNLLLITLQFLIFQLLTTVKSQKNWMRRRVPISVASPEYIRLSSDPKVTQDEKIMARTKGVNICVKRVLKKETFKEKICRLNPIQCRRLHKVKHAAAFLQQFYTKYECCPGFESAKFRKGCPKDKFSSKYNIIQVATKLGLTFFASLAKKSLAHYMLRKARPLTVFIPTNQALKRYIETEDGAKLTKNEYYIRLLIAMHVFGGKWPTSALKGRHKLESFLPEKYREANFIFYASRLVIQNTRVLRQNEPASNGIIHVIDDIFQPSFGTIRSIIKRHKKLKMFNEGLTITNANLTGHNTVFAPSDDAFQKMKIYTKEDMIQSFKCFKEFILTHIIRGLFFTAILRDRPRLYIRSYSKEFLSLAYKNEEMSINSMAVKIKYIAAKDGAVYIIDRLLIRPKALSIQKVLQAFPSISKFTEIMKKSAFEDRFLSANDSFTLFLPSNGVMRYAQSQNLNESEAEFLKNYVVKGRFLTSRLKNNRMLESMHNGTLWISNQGGEKICVQGSRMSRRLRNIQACNAAIHVITSSSLHSSNKSLLDIVKKDSRLSLLSMALRIAGLTKLLEEKSPITFFAPSNEAWHKLKHGTLLQYFSSDKKLKDLLKYHAINGIFTSCNLLTSKISPFSLAKRRVRIASKDYFSGKIRFNYAVTTQENIIGRNGVLHIIDDVVMYLYKRRHYV